MKAHLYSRVVGKRFSLKHWIQEKLNKFHNLEANRRGRIDQEARFIEQSCFPSWRKPHV